MSKSNARIKSPLSALVLGDEEEKLVELPINSGGNCIKSPEKSIAAASVAVPETTFRSAATIMESSCSLVRRRVGGGGEKDGDASETLGRLVDLCMSLIVRSVSLSVSGRVVEKERKLD